MSTDTTVIVLPDQKFESDYLDVTLKHIRYHFKESEIHYLGYSKLASEYKGKFENLHTIEAGQVKLDDLPVARSADRIVLVTNADGSDGQLKWSKELGVDIYKNYMHGFGGIRKVRYREDDQPCFKLKKKNAFHKIADRTTDGMIFFPYMNFSYIYSKFGQEVNHEFGFRVPDDYQKLAQRDKNTKVIIFTGGSACYGFSSFMGERFTDLFESKMNEKEGETKYVVLNFAFENHQILNEIITYMLFGMELRPDLVVTFSGANDLIHGMVSDNALQKQYGIATQIELEKMAQRISGEPEDNLPHIKRNGFPTTNAAIVVKTYIDRMFQFRQMVEAQGGKFAAILQPMVYSKTRMSQREKELMSLHIAVINGRMANMKNAIVNPAIVRYIMDRYSQVIERDKLEHVYDFHKEVNRYGSEISIFNDTVHFGDAGEQVMADLLFEKLHTYV